MQKSMQKHCRDPENDQSVVLKNVGFQFQVFL